MPSVPWVIGKSIASSGQYRLIIPILMYWTAILAYEAKKEDRCAKWQEAAKSGKLLFSGEIPDYFDDALQAELHEAEGYSAADVFEKRVWHFVRAAEIMRNMIFYELLPAQGIIG